MIKKAMAVLGLLCVALPAWAQGTWNEIPCAEAYLELTPAVRCHKNSASRGAGDPIQAVGSAYNVSGMTDGILVSARVSVPVGDGTFIKVYTTENARSVIQGQHILTRDRATEWGDTRGFGNVTYMTFRAEGRECVGFDNAGPLFEYGYAWRLVGFACAYAVDNPEAFVKAVLGALRLGPPGSSKNALGGDIRPLAASSIGS